MRILSFVIVLFSLLSPLSALAEVSRETGSGADTTKVYLNSDTGTYKIGFSSNADGITSWSDPVNEISSTITRTVSGTGDKTVINPGRVYWKIRSAGNYALYLFKNSDELQEKDGTRRLSWIVTVPSLVGSGDIPIEANSNPSNVERFKPIFSHNFNGIMAVEVNSLPLDMTVNIPSDITDGEYHGTLTLNLVSVE